MKHIGWCFDKITEELMHLPRNMDSQKDKDQAIKVLDEVEGYLRVIEKLLKHGRYKKDLRVLSRSPSRNFVLQEHEIEELLKDVEHTAHLVDLYLKDLRNILEQDPHEWSFKVRGFVIGTRKFFEKDKGRLRGHLGIIKRYKEHLRRYTRPFHHKAPDLQRAISDRLGGERGELRDELHVDSRLTRRELKKILVVEKHLGQLLKV